MTDEQAERMIALLERIAKATDPVPYYDHYSSGASLNQRGLSGVSISDPHWLLCNQAMAGG